MRTCAFCGQNFGGERKRTGEHLISDSLLKSEPEYDMTYWSRTGRTYERNQLKIKDVCKTCNNGPLSVLDDYISQLYSDYFVKQYRKGDLIPFSFNYDMLARWLLKEFYNTARATSDRDCTDLSNMAAYILGTGYRPPGIGLVVRIITKFDLPKAMSDSLSADQLGFAKGGFPARLFYMDHIDNQNCRVNRRIILNGFEFRVIVPRNTGYIIEFNIARMLPIAHRNPGNFYVLSQKYPSMEIQASDMSILDVLSEPLGKLGPLPKPKGNKNRRFD